jgi:DMSO/TMAO reductase YedYZ molybdopterin-dependent catalytic subunit
MSTLDRREFLGATVAAGATLGHALPAWAQAGLDLPKSLPEGLRASAVLETLPGKKPLIKLSYRPPNYETPLEYFRTAITPNDAFFVRYHLSVIPEVNANTWKMSVGGEGANGQAEITLADLRAMPAVEVVAVNQCSGNRRGLFEPHVPGVEWGYGAMGCARWKGVRLKDVLDKVKLKKEAIEIVFDGADSAPIDKTPDFIKSIPVWRALDESTIIAYEMNGAPLPHLHGAPARLIVPGWTGTYWMKHLVSVQAVSQPLKNFWMASAYRIPKGKFPIVDRFLTQETDANTPITEMVVNSVITGPRDGQVVKSGQAVEVKGLAWDNGAGIQSVDVSSDSGRTWQAATLDEDMGRFSFRGFRHAFKAGAKGDVTVLARASNRQGATQVSQLIFNPAGYHNNVVSRVNLRVG